MPKIGLGQKRDPAKRVPDRNRTLHRKYDRKRVESKYKQDPRNHLKSLGPAWSNYKLTKHERASYKVRH